MHPDTYAALVWFALCAVVSLCAAGSLWRERRAERRKPNPYMGPWESRRPGEMPEVER